MSYRNPQIIVDRSSEIYAQGFANLGQQAAGMIEKENERKRKIIEEQKKEEKAFKLMLNDKALKAYEHADEVYDKVKGSSLLEQFQETYTGLLEGDGKNEGSIKAQTILALRGSDLSADERKRLYKQVSDAKAYEKTMVQAGGYIENDKNQYKENGTAGNIGNKFAWVGKDNKEKFGNMLAMFSIADEKVPWAESKKDLIRKNGANKIHVNTRIDTKNAKAANYIKDLKLEGKLGDVDEDGYINIHWEKDVTTFSEKGLMVEIPSAIDKVKTLETANLLENGKPVPGLVRQKSNIVTSYLNGKKVTSTRQYLDQSKFGQSNKELRDAIETHAAGIVKGKISLSEQQAYMQRLKGYKFDLEEWSDMDPDEKIKKIADNLSDNMISELGLGSFVPKPADENDVKFYNEQLDGKIDGEQIKKGDIVYVKTKESFSDIAKDPNKSPQTPDYSDVTSIVQSLKSGNYQDIAFPGRIDTIEKSNLIAKKDQNIVKVGLEAGNGKFISKNFDLNNRTSLYSLAEEIFKGESKEVRSKRSEFVNQMLGKNKASTSDNKEPTGSEDDPLIYKPQN